jgi:DNA-binding response OmpR family regulator
MSVNLLVVDDSPDVTMTIKSILEEEGEGYTVTIAESGEECLELLNNDFIPDAILLDIMMPGIDGMETFEKIREKDKFSSIPVIFLTAKTDQFTESQGRFLGDDFIQKPFEIDDVKIRVERAIDRYK